MPNHPGQWCSYFHVAAKLGCKVSVMRPDGYALATANWDHETITPTGPTAWSWTEWVEDPQPLLDWFADPTASPIITYYCLANVNGRPQRAIIALERVWAGDAWVCVGSIVPAALIPQHRQSAFPSP